MMLFQGVELGAISAPLHRIHIESDLVTGPVIVGIRSTLPIKGISMIYGNNLAGGKVTSDSIITNLPNGNNGSDEKTNIYTWPVPLHEPWKKDMLRVMQKIYHS